MANTLVDNNILTAYPVLRDVNTSSEQIQVVRMDVGVGTAESRVSTANPMPVTTVTPASTAVADGRKVVTTAGTSETLAASTACKKVDICALSSNTGIVVIGGSTVIAAVGTRRGFALYPNDKYLIEIDNLSKLYIDSTVSGEGVSYTYYT